MLLQTDKLTVTLQKDGRVLIEDFTFVLKRGDKIGRASCRERVFITV